MIWVLVTARGWSRPVEEPRIRKFDRGHTVAGVRFRKHAGRQFKGIDESIKKS
jgi:hypothetical protein